MGSARIPEFVLLFVRISAQDLASPPGVLRRIGMEFEDAVMDGGRKDRDRFPGHAGNDVRDPVPALYGSHERPSRMSGPLPIQAEAGLPVAAIACSSGLGLEGHALSFTVGTGLERDEQKSRGGEEEETPRDHPEGEVGPYLARFFSHQARSLSDGTFGSNFKYG
jgi:hypothetical protein